MSLLTRGDIRGRLQREGFTYLSTSDLNDIVDQAMGDVVRMDKWAWRQHDSLNQTLPLDIGGSVVRSVEVVGAGKVPHRTREELVNEFGNVTDTGTVQYYWM